MKVSYWDIKTMQQIDVEGDFRLGVRVTLENGDKFDISENSNFVGELLVAVDGQMAIFPRAANTVNVKLNRR